ncbi:hypothetical protein Landi51_02192 [Colletotrichum acutatum]
MRTKLRILCEFTLPEFATESSPTSPPITAGPSSQASPAVRRATGYLRSTDNCHRRRTDFDAVPLQTCHRASKEKKGTSNPHPAALLPTPPIFTPSRASTPRYDWSAGLPPASPNQSLDFIPPPCNPQNPDTATLGERGAGKAPTPAIAVLRCTVFVEDHGPLHTDHILFVAHAQPLHPRYRALTGDDTLSYPYHTALRNWQLVYYGCSLTTHSSLPSLPSFVESFLGPGYPRLLLSPTAENRT